MSEIWPGSGGDRPASSPHDALLGVTLRLHAQLERQLALLARLRSEEYRSEVLAHLADLVHETRRAQRDSDSLRLLCGAETRSSNGPRPIADVLGDVVALVGNPAAVTLRPAPTATIAPRAAAELRQLLAELLEEAGPPVVVHSRVSVDGGLVVELVADGHSSLPAPPSRAAVADALAHRSGSGLRLQRPAAGRSEPGLPLAAVLCPPSAVSVATSGRFQPARQAPMEHRQPGAAPAFLGIERSTAPLATDAGDELFGPLPVARGREPVGTPIFEAVASAWFQEDGSAAAAPGGRSAGAGEPLNWETPSDGEWRAAAARATRTAPATTTPAGLPRRRPGDQLVPPPRQSPVTRPDIGPDERAPERVRDRLATYQRGLRKGRHRAAEPLEAEAWWSEPSG